MATLFLTNRECPFHCVMCDLWKFTLPHSVPVGAIPRQIDYALAQLAAGAAKAGEAHNSPTATGLANSPSGPIARHIKLYNAGSFFDPRAIPREDYPAIAERVRSFERVIVECHPALVNQSCLRFRDLLAAAAESSPKSNGEGGSRQFGAGRGAPELEVAMGLETAHPAVLAKLNKQMSLGQFRRAAAFLCAHGLAVRAFVLVQPPFLEPQEALGWAKRSIDFAFACGAAVVSLIPTRSGNGAMEALAQSDSFRPPSLSLLEAALTYGVGLQLGRVFADLWDLTAFADCPACFAARASRLREMNLRQRPLPPVRCERCGVIQEETRSLGFSTRWP